MLLHGFAAHASQASCRAYGANADDVATFEDAALAGASQGLPSHVIPRHVFRTADQPAPLIDTSHLEVGMGIPTCLPSPDTLQSPPVVSPLQRLGVL